MTFLFYLIILGNIILNSRRGIKYLIKTFKIKSYTYVQRY